MVTAVEGRNISWLVYLEQNTATAQATARGQGWPSEALGMCNIRTTIYAVVPVAEPLWDPGRALPT